MTTEAPPRPRPRSDFFDRYTRDLTSEEVSRLFTHDARDAYRYYSRGVDRASVADLPPWRRVPTLMRSAFLAFTLKLSPARRLLYGLSLVLALLGLLRLFTGIGVFWASAGIIDVPLLLPTWRPGTTPLIFSFVLLNLWCCWRWRIGSR